MKGIKTIILLIFIIISVSCKEEKGKYLYDFDEIVYYKLKIDEVRLLNTLDNPHKLNKIQERESQIVFDDFPRTIQDTLILENIEKEDFKKIDVSQKFNKQIKEIFRENHKERQLSIDCAPIYRDLLILKKQNKKVGIVKICFECGQVQFIGTKLDTDNFGTKGEFKKLKEILNKIK